LNCKYYYNGTCNNNTLNITSEYTIKDAMHKITEDGILHELVEENFDIKDISNLFFKQLIENEYIKKAKINKLQDIDIYNIESELHEIIEETIFQSILPLADKISNNRKITISDPREFCCNKWE